ncbi:MAG: hypothetical protein HFH84_07955 [Lachnospiraceae bacterium]|jgi:hypothetical protein|nr:hypothetical protein [Lachnospiraceae bacterium]
MRRQRPEQDIQASLYGQDAVSESCRRVCVRGDADEGDKYEKRRFVCTG